ncbi:MAG: type II toxin-antitoxin system VapC family toxin [Muribaculaceae bacterium]|nr:type II toxin-antitoxin system VapC family toxin [Muribaculaceae bacterium]MCM1398975.1 type II toxin-antitoxin system VapC family toxin [Clostridium sp.]MCM1458833.1 type II toxin-antitoxin system VapC family toxin [Bacteroides sp.]
MRKLKVYLDTSVISYLSQDDAPERMKDTLELWKEFVNGKYDIYLSQVTIDEIGKCSEPKKNVLFDYLSDIEYTKLEINAEIVELAQKIIDMGILRPKSFDDCQHIAAAVVNNCDCIISWNFRHIVNIKTIRGIRAITDLESYKGIDIINPSVLLESEG